MQRRGRRVAKITLMVVLLGTAMPTTGCDPQVASVVLAALGAAATAAAQVIAAATGVSLPTGSMTSPPSSTAGLLTSSTTPPPSSSTVAGYGSAPPASTYDFLATEGLWGTTPGGTSAGTTPPPADSVGDPADTAPVDGMPSADGAGADGTS